MSEFQSVHHHVDDNTPMHVWIFNRLVLIMTAGLSLATAAAVYVR